jgi:hypothetical protein
MRPCLFGQPVSIHFSSPPFFYFRLRKRKNGKKEKDAFWGFRPLRTSKRRADGIASLFDDGMFGVPPRVRSEG